MLSCIRDVRAWATANMLNLTDNKTELMPVTSKSNKHLNSLHTLINNNGNAQINFKQCEEFGLYIRMPSYYECTCLQFFLNMLL